MRGIRNNVKSLGEKNFHHFPSWSKKLFETVNSRKGDKNG